MNAIHLLKTDHFSMILSSININLLVNDWFNNVLSLLFAVHKVL